jgi:hypothetical protein
MTHDELLAELNSYQCGSAFAEMFKNALRAVVELHKPSGIFCRGCGFIEEYNEPAQLLPCPTIQAIEKELG